MHNKRLNLLRLIPVDTLNNAEGRLRRFIERDRSVEIVDKFIALINKSGAQITLESRNIQQSEDLGENSGSSSVVEEVLEEAFPYMENEVSDNFEPFCILVWN